MHKFDLEERTYEFARNIRDLVKLIPKSISNIEYCKQISRSSGSVAANYIEANESLSKKDFVMRIKISRKEAKETKLWLNLIDLENKIKLKSELDKLIQESIELVKIFNSILNKSSVSI